MQDELEYEDWNGGVYFLSIDLEVNEADIEADDEIMYDIELYNQQQITYDQLFDRAERKFGSIEERGI